jgi:MtrB/PioB family decaheme-associated outer membrane protein
MRRISVLALALGLVPGVAYAQTDQLLVQAQAPPKPAPAQPAQTQPPQPTGLPVQSGWLDFGVRGTSISGDEARFERYRDMGDGAALETVRYHREHRGWVLDFGADHAGRDDQRYRGDFVNPGKVKAWLLWDQIPLLMSKTTQTLFADTSTGVFLIDDALQRQVQSSPSSLETVFDTNARTFDTETFRHIFESGVEYIARPELTIKGLFRHINREGDIPYGGSFGHSVLVEMPVTVKHGTSDLDAAAEYTRDPVLLRFGYTGSWFDNNVTQAEFDNPFQATDISGTPSHGRLSLAPSNSFITVNGSASVRLPYRSRATAYVSAGSLKDDGAPLMPQTINSAITPNPVDRASVQGEGKTTGVNLTFVSRPGKVFDFNTRFRNYNYDNRTPVFTMLQRVSYDNSVSNATYSSLGAQTSPVGSVVTEPFGIDRTTFDADARAILKPGFFAGVGYSYLGEDRSHRVAEHTADNVLRLIFDAVGNQLFTLRTKYEHAQRSADVTVEAEQELFKIGEQPGMRHWDVAARDRNRVTILGSIVPTGMYSVNASFAAGKDDYKESEFGLRDNTHQVYSIGVDAAPRDTFSFNGSYSYERYNALSRSRQADPPPSPGFNYDRYLELAATTNPGVQVADASRNWATDGRDRAHSFIASAHFSRVAEKVDVDLTYDFSLSRSTYDYITGPVPDRTLPEEVIVPSTLPPPTALPPTRSELQRGTLDLMYPLNPRVSIGFTYWYERYRVEDFTLDFQAQPDLSKSKILLLGYLYAPYTANTFWGRVLFRF